MQSRTYDKTFLPLESNPEIFTSFAHNLGLSSTLKFTEVYDLDETPEAEVLAYVLAFPTNEENDEMVEARDQKHCVDGDEAKEAGRVEADPIGGSHGTSDETVLWLRQTIHNACGLYALLHATCNGAAKNHISEFFLFFRYPSFSSSVLHPSLTALTLQSPQNKTQSSTTSSKHRLCNDLLSSPHPPTSRLCTPQLRIKATRQHQQKAKR